MGSLVCGEEKYRFSASEIYYLLLYTRYKVAAFFLQNVHIHTKNIKKTRNRAEKKQNSTELRYFFVLHTFCNPFGHFFDELDSTSSFLSPRSLSSSTCITCPYSNAAVGEVGIQRF